MAFSARTIPPATQISPAPDVKHFNLAFECVQDASCADIPKLSPAALTVLGFVAIVETSSDFRAIKLDDAAVVACLAISQVYYHYLNDPASWLPEHRVAAWNSLVTALNTIHDIAQEFVEIWKRGRLGFSQTRPWARGIVKQEAKIERAMKAFEVTDHEAMWTVLDQLIRVGKSQARVLNNTTNPYFLESLALVNGCQRIRLHANQYGFDAQAEIRQISVLSQVAFDKAAGKEVQEQSHLEVREAFQHASEVIDDFLNKHNIECLGDSEFRSSAEVDSDAKRHLQNVKSYVRIQSRSGLRSIECTVSFWDEMAMGGWDHPHRVSFLIEEIATLDVLLVHLISFMPVLVEKGISPFGLVQNPQFFLEVPSSRKRLTKILTNNKIDPLGLHNEVTHYGVKPEFHLIVDRKSRIDKKEVQQFAPDMAREIIQNYTNIWRLEDRYYISRERTGSLVLLYASVPSQISIETNETWSNDTDTLYASSDGSDIQDPTTI